MIIKRLLIFVFWFIVWLSAIYLRTALFPNNGLLILVSTIDVALLFCIHLCTIYFLQKIPDNKIVIKLGTFFFIVLLFSLVRFMVEGYQMGFWETSIIKIGPKMVVTKILSSVVIFGISLTYFLGEKFIESKEEKMNYEIEKKQMELDFLKSRVNPHFLFNMLSNIHGLAQFKSEKTAPMISGLSELMRYMFYDCQQDQISLAKEVEFISNYISLNRLKCDKELSVHFDHNILNHNFKIAPLIFVSFIENAFKHGDIFQDGFILIKLIQSKNKIQFFCENSFIKRLENHQTSEQSGFGLANVRKQLAAIYPEQHTLSISSNESFNIHLTISF